MFKFIFTLFVFQVFGNILQVASLPPPEEASDTLSTRIVGGTNAPQYLAPYQVSLRFSDANFHFCGGTILNKRWILTAAHCTIRKSKDSMVAVVGTINLKEGGDRYKLDSIIMHEDYNDTTILNDICVIKVDKDIKFNDRVQSIRLPDKDTGAGEAVLATGWGKLSYYKESPDKLQAINLTTVRVDECQRALSSFTKRYPVDGRQLCTYKGYNKGMCPGDSGGPLVQNGTVVGVSSWGIPCAEGYPDVFNRVYYFKHWILSKISDSK